MKLRTLAAIAATTAMMIGSSSFAESLTCGAGVALQGVSKNSTTLQNARRTLGRSTKRQKSLVAEVVVDNALDITSAGIDVVDTAGNLGVNSVKTILEFAAGTIENAVMLSPNGIAVVTVASGYKVLHLVIDAVGNDLARIAMYATNNLVNNTFGSTARWIKSGGKAWYGVAAVVNGAGAVINGVVQITGKGVQLLARGAIKAACYLGKALNAVFKAVLVDIPRAFFVELPKAVWGDLKKAGRWVRQDIQKTGRWLKENAGGAQGMDANDFSWR